MAVKRIRSKDGQELNPLDSRTDGDRRVEVGVVGGEGLKRNNMNQIPCEIASRS